MLYIMEYNIKHRKNLYKKFVQSLNKTGRNRLDLKKKDLLGKGYQGIVYNYCDKKNCVAVKKVFLENKQARYLKNPFSIPALKYENFIELASMKLTNPIVLQKICPHFILHYKSTIKKSEAPCEDEYPYSSKYYNEYIDGGITYTKWVKQMHTKNEWYNAYFQITVAIYCLQKYFNMIHLDLHSDNILVKRVKSGGYWKYIINGKSYYVPNYGFIFFINDFGHAWIPENFQSWIVRKKYKTKVIHKNFDIMKLFNSTLNFSTSSPSFKNEIKQIIKDLETNKNFTDIIESMWDNYLKRQTNIIESYNLDKPVSLSEVPKELHYLILHKE